MTASATRTRTETIPERIVRLALVEKERAEGIHGRNSWPLGTGSDYWTAMANQAKHETAGAFAAGKGTWLHLVREEVFEAFAEGDPQPFVVEGLQAIGVLVAAIEDVMTANPDLALPPPF